MVVAAAGGVRAGARAEGGVTVWAQIWDWVVWQWHHLWVSLGDKVSDPTTIVVLAVVFLIVMGLREL